MAALAMGVAVLAAAAPASGSPQATKVANAQQFYFL
jgi:hypothetical protein